MRNLCLTVLVALVVALSAPAYGLGTAFTYQGRLVDGTSPANGTYDLEFTLFKAAVGTSPIATLLVQDVAVTGGLFAVELDFRDAFDAGDDRWLEIGARPGASTGRFTTLTPRQPLTPAPFALFASTAGGLSGSLAGEVTGNITATVVSNAVSTNTANRIVRRDGSGSFSAGSVTLSGNLNLEDTTSASVGVIMKGGSRFLHNRGVENTFLGALAGNFTLMGSSNLGLGTRTLQNLSNGDGNIALGASAGLNLSTGSNNIYIGSMGGPSFEFDTIRIGVAQDTASLGSHLLRGSSATGNMFFGNPAGPVGPVLPAAFSTAFGVQVLANLAGGGENSAFGSAALRSLGVGSTNSAVGARALQNLSNGDGNIALGASAGLNLSTGSNNIYIGSMGGPSFELDTIRIGVAQDIASLGSHLLRGSSATGNMFFGNPAGPVGPVLPAAFSTAFGVQVLANLAGGGENSAFGSAALRSLGVGSTNSAVGARALQNLSNGDGNIALGASAGLNLSTGSNNIYIGSMGGPSFELDTIRIGVAQDTASLGSHLLRGSSATGNMFFGNPAGPVGPVLPAAFSTAFGVQVLANLAGGGENSAFGSAALRSLGVGSTNSAVGAQALSNLSNGDGNIALGASAGLNLLIGSNNIYIGSIGGASSESNTIRLGAGQTNTFLSGAVSMPSNASVGGNLAVTPAGKVSFGTQFRQMLDLSGSDYGIGVQTAVMYSRTTGNLKGGFAWYRGGVHNDSAFNPGGGTTMMALDIGGLTVNGTFVSSSDRAAKQDLRPIDAGRILDEIGRLPISEWSYKADPGVRHVGPMAQDFRAAFGLGADDRHIATVDADGVAFAAIQALNRLVLKRLAEQQAEIGTLRAELEALRRGLETERSSGGSSQHP